LAAALKLQETTVNPSYSPSAMPSPASGIPAKPAGIALALATIISIIFVAMDQGASGNTPETILQSMVTMRTTKAIVHLVAIACVLAYAYGYTALAARLDLRKPLVLAGLTTYLLSCAAMLGATVIDGFISNDVAASFLHASSPEGVKTGYNLVVLLDIVLNDLAKLAWVLQALSALAWSACMLGNARQRVTAIVGVLSSGLVLGLIFTVGANMSMAALLGILAAQAIWNLAAAIQLVRWDRVQLSGSAPVPQAA
jgi:hypothetical protein